MTMFASFFPSPFSGWKLGGVEWMVCVQPGVWAFEGSGMYCTSSTKWRKVLRGPEPGVRELHRRALHSRWVTVCTVQPDTDRAIQVLWWICLASVSAELLWVVLLVSFFFFVACALPIHYQMTENASKGFLRCVIMAICYNIFHRKCYWASYFLMQVNWQSTNMNTVQELFWVKADFQFLASNKQRQTDFTVSPLGQDLPLLSVWKASP